MIELSNQSEINQHRSERKALILDQYRTEENPDSKVITKSELDKLYPTEKFERYSLTSLDSFRKEILKSEVDNADEVFKQATTGLKSFMLVHEGNKGLVFLREKVVGE